MNKENSARISMASKKAILSFLRNGPSFFFIPVVARTVTNYYRRSSRNKQPASFLGTSTIIFPPGPADINHTLPSEKRMNNRRGETRCG